MTEYVNASNIVNHTINSSKSQQYKKKMLRKECLQCEKSLEGGGNDIISFIVQNKKKCNVLQCIDRKSVV